MATKRGAAAAPMPAYLNQRDLDKLREGSEKGVEFEINEEENNEESDEEQFFPPEEVLNNVYIPEDEDTDDENDDLSPFERLGKKMQDISGDGGVKKRILHKGEGNPPPDGAIFRVHYNAFLEYADEPFDSTRLRNKPERYKLGKGQVIEGLDIAIATMKKGELAQLLIGPDYAFGQLGVVPRIPPNATVMFKIELLNYVEYAGIEDYDLMTPEEKEQVPFSDIVNYVDVERQLGLQQYKEKAYNRAFAHYKKAAMLLENRHVKDRQEDEEKADKLCTLFTNMAVCKSKQNHFGAVIKYCNSGRQYKPNHVKLLFLQGKANRKCSNFDRAMELLKKAQRMNPNSTEISQELQELDKDIKRFGQIERDMYSKMFSNPTGQSDAERERENEQARQKEDKSLNVSDNFQRMVEEKLLEFIQGQDDEMPFPAYNLSVGEIACMIDKCENLGLNCRQVGTGSNVRLKIVKPQ